MTELAAVVFAARLMKADDRVFAWEGQGIVIAAAAEEFPGPCQRYQTWPSAAGSRCLEDGIAGSAYVAYAVVGSAVSYAVGAGAVAVAAGSASAAGACGLGLEFQSADAACLPPPSGADVAVAAAVVVAVAELSFACDPVP